MDDAKPTETVDLENLPPEALEELTNGKEEGRDDIESEPR